jgi:hypothetical protein
MLDVLTSHAASGAFCGVADNSSGLGAQMVRKVGTRFWIESVLAAVTSILFLVTLVWREWIEAVFKVDPDGGDGSLEWAIVGVLFAASATLSVMARAEWRRRAALVS